MTHEEQIADMQRRLDTVSKLYAELLFSNEETKEERDVACRKADHASAALVHAVNRCGDYDDAFKKAVEARARRMVRARAEELKKREDAVAKKEARCIQSAKDTIKFRTDFLRQFGIPDDEQWGASGTEQARAIIANMQAEHERLRKELKAQRPTMWSRIEAWLLRK